jgi:hypothetical protein
VPVKRESVKVQKYAHIGCCGPRSNAFVQSEKKVDSDFGDAKRGVSAGQVKTKFLQLSSC